MIRNLSLEIQLWWLHVHGAWVFYRTKRELWKLTKTRTMLKILINSDQIKPQPDSEIYH